MRREGRKEGRKEQEDDSGKKILEPPETGERELLRGETERRVPRTKVLEPAEMADGRY